LFPCAASNIGPRSNRNEGPRPRLSPEASAEFIREIVKHMFGILARSIITSAAASATTGAALMLLGRHEHRGALTPLNASSHWLYGDHVGRKRRADLAHTGVGLATHHLAVMFWSLALESALGGAKKTLPELALAGALNSASAAAFDYLVVPRRLSPGWELALSRKAMTGAFAAMALGLATGAAAARMRK
jgi:hypothetical protein